MAKIRKAVEHLTPGDFEVYPVWQFLRGDARGETHVKPVTRLPVSDLGGKIVGAPVKLANGSAVWGLIGNISPNDPRRTEFFVTLSIERQGQWYPLARYHDYDYERRGPAGLAEFLGLPVDDVFPIEYDVSRYLIGDPAATAGKVLREPRERIPRAELIAMIVG